MFEFKSRKSRVALLYVSFKLPLTKCYISLNSCLFARYSFLIFSKYLNIWKFYFYEMYLFCVCEYIRSTICVQYAQRSEDGTGLPETGVMHGCVPPRGAGN